MADPIGHDGRGPAWPWSTPARPACCSSSSRPAAASTPPSSPSVAGRDWLRAWALVDLEKAESLFEAQLAALEGAKGLNLGRTGFFRMTGILTLPPHRRVEEVFQMDAKGRPVLSR